MAANHPSPEVRAILKLTPDLITALSNEPLGVANELLSKGLISDEVYSEVLMPTSSAARIAAIMIESARKVIKLTPSKFIEFLEILSELSCARLVESLRSTCQSELALASQIVQGSGQFSMPSSSVTFTRTPPPTSTVSLVSSIAGPSPSQMIQYQERSLAHHGIEMQHTTMGQLQVSVSHPRAAAATGVQGIQSMIRVSQPSLEVAHSQVAYMDVMQLPNVYPPQQAQYMGYSATEMQVHQASGRIYTCDSRTVLMISFSLLHYQ